MKGETKMPAKKQPNLPLKKEALLPVLKVAELSTCHVTRQDADRLADGEPGPLIAYPYDEGFYVLVPPDLESNSKKVCRFAKEAILEAFSPAMLDVLMLAAKQGFRQVRFDCDSPKVPGLQKFDW